MYTPSSHCMIMPRRTRLIGTAAQLLTAGYAADGISRRPCRSPRPTRTRSWRRRCSVRDRSLDRRRSLHSRGRRRPGCPVRRRQSAASRALAVATVHPVEYPPTMREFLILVSIVALGACTSPSQSEVVQIERDTEVCPHNYPCSPGTPWSAVICDAVCGPEGGYCEPYTPGDELWCQTHRGMVENGLIMCDRWGNPTWQTLCKAYWVP